MRTGKVALVAGGLGVVGRAMVEHLAVRGGWQIVALSRRPPDFDTPARFISVDLTDPADLRVKLQGLEEVTHVFYAAYAPCPDLGQEAAVNARMLVNLIDVLEPRASRLQHVQVIHGSKWYGNHLGPYKTPALEDDPRHDRPCFYYDQQDWFTARQKGKAWTWSALRPHGVLGLAVGSSMNQLTALALYAAISRELGQLLRRPGAGAAFSCVYQFTEAAYLARGMEWAATTAAAANQAFNFTNGDLVRWRHLWPKLADAFGMDAGEPAPSRLPTRWRTRSLSGPPFENAVSCGPIRWRSSRTGALPTSCSVAVMTRFPISPPAECGMDGRQSIRSHVFALDRCPERATHHPLTATSRLSVQPSRTGWPCATRTATDSTSPAPPVWVPRTGAASR